MLNLQLSKKTQLVILLLLIDQLQACTEILASTIILTVFSNTYLLLTKWLGG